MTQNQQKINELYARLQEIDQEIKAVQQQMQTLEQQLGDLAQVKQALEDLGTIEPGREILVPVAGGIFIRATIGDTQKMLVNVGASVNVDKSLPDVQALIDEQGKDIERNYLHAQEHFKALFEEATSINEQVTELIS